MEAKHPRPFVDDLVPLILESTDHWWTRDYVRLAQVSPAWLYYVRRRLYAYPTLYSFNACASLAQTLRDSPYIAKLVRGIELHPTSEEEGTLEGIHVEGIRALLGLEGLQRVVIGGSLSQRAERFINTLSFPETVTELVVSGRRVSDCFFSRPSSLELDESFAYRFPNLRSLELNNLELDILPRDPQSLPIKRLALTEVAVVGGSLSHLVTNGSLDTLSIDTTFLGDYDRQVRSILRTCTVKSIQYRIIDRCDSLSPLPWYLDVDLETDGELRELHLNTYVDRDLFPALTRCHPALEELTVDGRYVQVGFRQWIDFISSASHSLPSLRRVKLSGWTWEPPLVKWTIQELETTKALCLERNISLLH